jgi:hypothetical protein
MSEDEKRIHESEGHVRALEAILLEMPELTKERVEAARNRIRERVRGQDRGRHRALIEKIESISPNRQLDQPAEDALDQIADQLKTRDK